MTHEMGLTRAGTVLRLAVLTIASVGATRCSGKEADGQHSAVEQQEAEGPPSENRVTLSEAAIGAAGILVEQVRQEAWGGAAGDIEVPGQVAFDQTRIALISPRTSGRIERVAVVDGDRVRAGAPIALVLSPAFLTAQGEFTRAVQRAERLKGTADAEGARALADAAGRRLRLLGVPETEIARLGGGGEPADFLVVTAPFAGSIVEVQALPGAAVEAGTPIAKIADLSVVTVVVDLPERALPGVRPGQRAVVRLVALPGTELEGRIERIRDELDPATRTVKALIRVPNSDRRLKAGMFATVTLAISEPAARERDTGGGAGLLTVPASAVVADGEARYVFVEIGMRTYERRVVVIEPPTSAGLPRPNARAVVRDGLVAGDRVVTHGAFTLKSELAKSSFGEEHD